MWISNHAILVLFFALLPLCRKTALARIFLIIHRLFHLKRSVNRVQNFFQKSNYFAGHQRQRTRFQDQKPLMQDTPLVRRRMNKPSDNDELTRKPSTQMRRFLRSVGRLLISVYPFSGVSTLGSALTWHKSGCRHWCPSLGKAIIIIISTLVIKIPHIFVPHLFHSPFSKICP